MNDIAAHITAALEYQPARVVLSNPFSKQAEVTKAVLIAGPTWTVEQYSGKTHQSKSELEETPAEYLVAEFGTSFKQMDVYTDTTHYGFKLSKKGKLLTSKAKFKTGDAGAAAKEGPGAPRSKSYLIPEGTVVPPLVDLGVFSQQGKIIASKYDKYRQINRFLELVDDVISAHQLESLHIVDFGCGKSYLTFILYYFLTEVRNIPVSMVGLDLKPNVIADCQAAAVKYGYENLSFQLGDIEGYQPDRAVDMVISLHACDTATDYALFNAIEWDVRFIMSVPCCQHELNQQIKSTDLAALTRYGIVKERIAALITDTVRANLLMSAGYKTQLVEFVDFEHTPKNILIRAVKSNIQAHTRNVALDEVKALMGEFDLRPTLYTLMHPEDAQ